MLLWCETDDGRVQAVKFRECVINRDRCADLQVLAVWSKQFTASEFGVVSLTARGRAASLQYDARYSWDLWCVSTMPVALFIAASVVSAL